MSDIDSASAAVEAAINDGTMATEPDAADTSPTPPPSTPPTETNGNGERPLPTDSQLADAGLTPGQIKQLKDENARFRRERNEYAQPWEGWDPDSRSFVSEAIAAAGRGDLATANAMFSQLLAALNGPQGQPEAEPPLTRSELAQFFAEQQEQQEMAHMVQTIRDEARQLGVDPDDRANYEAFLGYARLHHGGDLQSAKSAMDAYQAKIRQQAIDEYVAGKTQSASSKPTVATGSPGAPAPVEAQFSTIDEATDALRKALTQPS